MAQEDKLKKNTTKYLAGEGPGRYFSTVSNLILEEHIGECDSIEQYFSNGLNRGH